MKNLGYLVFHLNLAFSSIDENERDIKFIGSGKWQNFK